MTDLTPTVQTPILAPSGRMGRVHVFNLVRPDVDARAPLAAPEAFMVRRSMPYSAGSESGLCFLAFGKSLERYERVLRRMLGLEDGLVDGLFEFSRAVSGGYYFCPPLAAGKLDLRAIEL